jgi:FkbM family methyltransferase
VEEGDVVFDVGASVGPFSFSILSSQPSKIYCFEPHEILFKTLKKNLGDKAVCINAGIAESDGETVLNGLYNPDSMAMWSYPTMAKTINFMSFVKKNGIEKIDFLKCDCEGGEYCIFDPKNKEWILGHVRKVAGEWHLHNPELKNKFRIFRDNMLLGLPDELYQINSMDGQNIKEGLLSEEFIQNNTCIMVYMRMPEK